MSEGDVVRQRLSSLAAVLRAQGSRVGVGELVTAHRALATVDCGSREDSRLALRAVLCSSRADLARFDAAFLAVFGDGADPDPGPLEELASMAREALPRAAIPAAVSPVPQVSDDNLPVPAAWSEVELLRTKDFAHYSDSEMALARELIAHLARRGPSRLSRRTRPVRRRRGHRPDLRRVLRASLRTRGEPIQRHWRAPQRRPRPVVLVCDISGSMTPYARMLLQYMHASVAARRRVEAFAFGTRLTRLTNELEGRDHDRALDRATAAVADFSGGTRIGSALAELNRVHGRRLGRGAVVVILSDGWDRGEPELLEAEMARLRRSAHRLVWLNPLAAHPDFEPLTRGMRAAVPHTDELLAGNSLASLEELAAILEEI
ncbi:MAG TPA: VWA domain-containing protein [Solirubrobacteraceae bacterium]|nr:VWA domain-containing protein [Solirubrobacteraceae bacterium]